LSIEQRAAAEAREHAQEHQRAWAEATRELERVKRDLQHHRTEMASGIREQLQAAESAAAQAREELAAVRRAKDDFASRIAAAEETADCAQNAYKREISRAERLEKELIALRKAKNELTERLRDEQSEAAKSKGQAAMDRRVRESVNALGRATADLEKERRRLEQLASQSRLGAADLARVGKAYLQSFRTQLRTPADHLIVSIRRLVSLSLDQDQRKLAEAALEHAVVLHTKLAQEPVMPDVNV